MYKKLVFVDAETDGLYGGFLTVAMKAVDEKGTIIDQGYWGIRKEKLQICDPWVLEHVAPILGQYKPCEDEDELLEKAWAFWMKHRGEAYAVADVPYPVECRLFSKCVEKDPDARMMLAPFPLLDLASMLYARGMDPLTARRQLLAESDGEMIHNAAFDVDMTETILRKMQEGQEL